MATQLELIKDLVQSLIKSGKAGTTGDAALTSFLNKFGLSNYAALKTKFVDALSGCSSAQTFLENVCGIRVNNTDTGAITGSDAGGSTTKTDDSIIPESTAAVELTDSEYNSFTKDGLTVNITYDTSSNGGSNFGNDKDVYLTKQRLVVRALYNWWIPEAVSLIKESLGIDFSNGSNLNSININFSNYPYSYETLKVNVGSDMGLASVANLTINMGKLATITESDINGTISGNHNFIYLPTGNGKNNYNYYSDDDYYKDWTNKFDRFILMGLTELALRANIPYYYNLPSEIQDGLRKLVNGFDDGGIKNSASTYNSGVAALTSDGYALLRFLARNYAGFEYNDDKTEMTITDDYVHASLPSNFVSVNSNVVTINAASSTLTLNISGNESPNVIVGTSAADTINGKVGNDTITGGAGNDVFIYTAGEGNDVITDYATGDLFSITSGGFNTVSSDGTDVVFTIGNSSVTFKNAFGKTININNDILHLQGSPNHDSLTGTDGNDQIDGGAGNDVVNGGAGGDLIIGGKGNDTLTGGAGADFFVYLNGDGDDVITDYAAGQDKISILSGKISKSSLSGSDVVLTIGSGTITVKNAKGQQITVIDSDNNVTSKVYTNSEPETSLTVTNATASSVTVGSAIKTINASTRTTAVKIKGNTLANSIVGGSGADSISGLAGADTLNGGKGNDTLIGGAGNDVFFYTKGEGNDVITDYAVGDKVKITGAKITKTSVSGSDVVLTVGTGKLTLKKAAGKKLSLYNNSNTLTNTVIGGSATVTLNDSSKTPATAASTVNIIDATKRTKAIKITGNSLANTIKGGSGVDSIFGGAGNDSILGNKGNDKLNGDAGNDTLRGGAGNDSLSGGAGNDKLFGDAGADTLNGGKGNDTLTGGAGADVFVYKSGDGNDVITDYTAQDKLKITGSYSTVASGKNVIITVGSGKLTLKNAKGLKLNITKANNYEERWFTKDDNHFTTSDVSSILKSDNLISNDYSLTNELKLNQSSDITSLTYNQTQKK